MGGEGPVHGAEESWADAGAAADEIHARCAGGPSWCVGTSADPWHRLVAVHGVSLVTGQYAVVECTDAGVALGAARLLRLEHGYRPARHERGPDCVYLFAFAAAAGTELEDGIARDPGGTGQAG